MNSESDFGIKYRENFVNENLRGKRIKRLFEAESRSVMIEFEDGSQGRIEVLNEDQGEPYLSVMTPNNLSEAYRKFSGENVKVDSAMESLDVPRLDRASENPSEVTGSDGPCNPVGYDVQIDPCVGESFEGHAVNVVGGNLRKITEVDRSLS